MEHKGSETPEFEALLSRVERVIEAVTTDECGRLVAGQWVGGNGGLLSRSTIAEVDNLRRELQAFKDAVEDLRNAKVKESE